MFLLLSKLLDLLLAPLTWSLLLVGLAVLARQRPRVVAALLLAAVAVLLAFASEQVSDRLSRHLEAGVVRTDRPGETYDAVIVLGGLADNGASRVSGQLEVIDSAERLLRAFDVVRTGHARHLLYACGIIDPEPGDVAESTLAVRQLEAWGIASDRLVAETGSRNTRENAVEAARVAAERGWKKLLLVTTAAHMPRALGCFRAVGLTPDALPVDFRGGDERHRGWLPRAAALEESTFALRELAGREVYRRLGYSKD